MKIVKVLNNSLLMALDDNGEEVILGGKGIGYKQSIGKSVEKRGDFADLCVERPCSHQKHYPYCR